MEMRRDLPRLEEVMEYPALERLLEEGEGE